MAEQLTGKDEIREAVRERYAAAATSRRRGARRLLRSSTGRVRASPPAGAARMFPTPAAATSSAPVSIGEADREQLPDEAKLASLGCGNPTAVAELHEGETVLDLGSGGGIDVLLSARRVGPTGKAYGVDMTDEMLELARRNQREAGWRTSSS